MLMTVSATQREVGAVRPADAPSGGPDHAPFVDLGEPLFEGPHGIRYDFNYGCRVKVAGAGWRVRVLDRDTDVVLYDEEVADTMVCSAKRYYVNFRIEVLRGGELVFEHDQDLRGKKVYARLPVSTIGDVIAWFPYVDEFRKRHGCEMYLSMGEELWSLFEDAYPDLHYVQPADEDAAAYGFYASYFLGIFFPASDRTHQPTDYRVSGLQGTIARLLSLPAKECRPRIGIRDTTRRIAERYVCIAAQASSQCKHWNNPAGWFETVRHLKAQGYRVLCIDRDAVSGQGLQWNHIPYGVEDFTGDLPLQERASLLMHCEFFVGLSSGLSWLAWAIGKPVVMISGFTHPQNEFDTAYRVINYHTCNSCWNDTAIEFDNKDFMWCPRHGGTERQFECSRLITPGQVTQTIDRVIEDLKTSSEVAERITTAVEALSPYVLANTRHGPMLANQSDFYIGHGLIDHGEYSEIELQFLLRLIDRPGLILEVGANTGSHTIALAKRAAAVGAQMIAFEPQPFIFQNLCANLALNGIDNVVAWPWACSNSAGTVYFNEPDYKATGNFGAVSMSDESGPNTIAVPCVRLDDVIGERPVALIKVDVEGFEEWVLQGASQILKVHRPLIYFENDRVDRSASLIEWLWSQGYKVSWHLCPLFNPGNFRHNPEDRWPKVHSSNMLAIPRESNLAIEGFTEVEDAGYHPLRKGIFWPVEGSNFVFPYDKDAT
jgi:autotransporter strand-loop-strand O-heptosyltransferase